MPTFVKQAGNVTRSFLVLNCRMKFGLVHVDFESGSLRRTPKDSLYFMRDLIEYRQLPIPSAAPAVLSAVLHTALAVLVVLQRPICFEVQ